jgi:hypothetical protein
MAIYVPTFKAQNFTVLHAYCVCVCVFGMELNINDDRLPAQP